MGPTRAKSASDALVRQAWRELGARLGDVWRSGARLPSVRELAGEMRVSHGTAQRALRQLVRQGFVVSQPRLGLFVSDQFTDSQLRAIFAQHAPDAPTVLRPLGGARACLVLDPLATHLLSAIEAVRTALAPLGCHVHARSYDDMRTAGARPTQVGPLDADIIVLFNPDSDWQVTCTPQQQLLVVTTAATTVQCNLANVDVVSVDQEQGAALAGRHLREAGCSGACFVGVGTRPPGDTAMQFELSAPPYRRTSEQRLRGFQVGWGEVLPESCRIYAGAYSPLSGSRAAARYAQMNPRPRGVFVASDDIATGFVNGLNTLGLVPARDYQLVSFDGQQLMRAMCPQTPCVEPPAQLMGLHAVQFIVDRRLHPDRPSRRLLLGCSLRQESSC
jgi:DNA-binding LacI/PurR family transcriptional regulator